METIGTSLNWYEQQALAEQAAREGYDDLHEWRRHKLLAGLSRRIKELRERHGSG